MNVVLKTTSVLILLAGLVIWLVEHHFVHVCTTVSARVTSQPLKHDQISGIGIPYSHHNEYSFQYVYQVAGHDYSGITSERYDPGKTFTIYYDPANPSHHTTTEPDASLGRGFFLLGVFFTFITFLPRSWISKIET